jgi:hypothetical protein
MRITRARSFRTTRRNFSLFRICEEGISSDTRDQSRKDLRIASSTPPALSLSKVLNSRNSLPCPLMPRTKTGMARESRALIYASLPGSDPGAQQGASQLSRAGNGEHTERRCRSDHTPCDLRKRRSLRSLSEARSVCPTKQAHGSPDPTHACTWLRSGLALTPRSSSRDTFP